MPTPRDALLALIDRDRQQACARLFDEANAQARDIVAAAHREARERVRTQGGAAREQAAAACRALEADRDTRLRQHGQRSRATLLARAWPLLADALRARWADPTARGAWIDALLAQAGQLLPAGAWRVVLAPGGTTADHERIRMSLAAADVQAALTEAADLTAGLRIETAAGTLDATADGLLADRADVEARLLAWLHGAGGA